MFRFIFQLFILSLFLPQIAAAKDPSFLNNILKHIDEKEDSFSDSFSKNSSFYQQDNDVVSYTPGPSKTPLFSKRNQLYDLVDGIKSLAGITKHKHLDGLVEAIEKSFGESYLLPSLSPCIHSRIITREARLPSLMPDSVEFLYYDGAARTDRPRTYRFGRHAISYESNEEVYRLQKEDRLPLYLAEVVGITCLPTYVRSISASDLEFHEGEAAWQVEK